MGHWISSSAELELVRRAAQEIDRFGATGWGRAVCPLCPGRTGSPDRRGALGVDDRTGYFHCFRCAARGRIDVGRSEKELAPPMPGERRRRRDDPPQDPELGPPEDFTPLWTGDGATSIMLEPARAYLRRRGVAAQTIAEVRIGACLRGRAAGRVVVPVLDLDGRTWLGWQARVWDRRSTAVRYLSATGMDRESHVFNAAALAVETEDPVLVVEGIFDALPYWPDVVALLGKPSEGQIAALLSAARPIVVALDGDAWLEAEMLAARLELDGARATWVKLPPKRDPGDVNPARLAEAVRRSAGRRAVTGGEGG